MARLYQPSLNDTEPLQYSIDFKKAKGMKLDEHIFTAGSQALKGETKAVRGGKFTNPLTQVRTVI